MGKSFDYIKHQLVNFKLDLFCWLAPVKIGLLVTGYVNIIVAIISLIALSDDSFRPVLMQVQDLILADNAKKPIAVLAYITEVIFHIILLCGVYRKDIPLMRLYQRYCIAAVVMSIMVYSMIVAVVGFIIGILAVVSIVFQFYVLVIVRSMIVEMRLEKKNLQLPTLVMSSLISEPKEVKVNHDVEAPSDSEESDDGKVENGDKDRLETVDEQSKEESSEDESKEKK